MTTIQRALGMSGQLATRKIRNSSTPSLRWRIKQWFRKNRLNGMVGSFFAGKLSRYFGVTTMTGQLRAIHTNGQTGEVTDYGIVSRHLVTTAFVNFVVDQLQTESTIFGDFKYHDSGVGVTAENITDVDIETTDGESRVSGTQIEGATPEIYKSVATITYTTTKAITEHGLFNAATGVTLMDRSVFTVINVVATDQIEFTYELTVDDGG